MPCFGCWPFGCEKPDKGTILPDIESVTGAKPMTARIDET